MKSVFEKSYKGNHAYSLPKEDPEFHHFHPDKSLLRKSEIDLPEISELDLTRHFSWLARRNMGIDTHFYPLGSCTMKLNPRINELCAALPGFTKTHPLAPKESVQGNLEVIREFTSFLAQLCGMTGGTLLPNAGAQGEFVGVKMMAAYHKKRGDHKRDEMLVPDNAHGTNPATAAMSGLKTITIKSTPEGDMDLDDLASKLSERTAGLMLTNPNTLGLFSPRILEIAKLVHQCGGLLYYDGANLNPILNIVRPGDMGFDVMHINLHKTFSTPHGGGGPGSGPVLCNDRLKEFLPEVAPFHGNFGIYLRAFLYAKLHGNFGLRKIAEMAVLNANYLKVHLGKLFTVPYPQPCMHEFVLQATNYLDKNVKALDIAKRLLDYGVHAPTIYFPLIVKECMLIEPTESESKDTLDRFIHILELIVKEIQSDPTLVNTAPHTLPVTRLDEVRAAKTPILKANH